MSELVFYVLETMLGREREEKEKEMRLRYILEPQGSNTKRISQLFEV